MDIQSIQQVNSKSNFDCYNLCIQDPTCKFVVMKAIPEFRCQFKQNFDSSNHIELSNGAEAMAFKSIFLVLNF